MKPIIHQTNDGNKRAITQPFIVVGCLVEKDNKFLMIKQNGKWNQPSGWLELGESMVNGAKREFEEETGLEVEVDSLLGVYTLLKQKNNKLLHAVKIIFRGHVTGQPKSTLEKMELGWLSREDIKNNIENFWDPDVINEVDDMLSGRAIQLDIINRVTRK